MGFNYGLEDIILNSEAHSTRRVNSMAHAHTATHHHVVLSIDSVCHVNLSFHLFPSVYM